MVSINFEGAKQFYAKQPDKTAAQAAFDTLVNGTGAGNDFIGWVDLPDAAATAIKYTGDSSFINSVIHRSIESRDALNPEKLFISNVKTRRYTT